MKTRDFSGISEAQLGLRNKHRSLEFRYLYFKIQNVVNTKVSLILKYEQLKSPEIHSTLMKPISLQVIELSDTVSLQRKLGRSGCTSAVDQTPRFGPQGLSSETPKLSTNLIFILLLLRYEFLLQSENNPLKCEILITRANVCELLAIRMLREYKSSRRVDVLLAEPMAQFGKSFNTLELSVLSRSKKFLSQPIITQTLDKFYNGELFINMGKGSNFNLEEQALIDGNVVNYDFNKITMRKVYSRSKIVPKYQSLVINMKLIIFNYLYCIMVLNYRNRFINRICLKLIEVPFWLIALSFNLEFLAKVMNIETIYWRRIIWFYVDIILIGLVDMAFLTQKTDYYHDIFSIISVVSLPRILSIFNNYEFFNMIILSIKKMSWNLIGLFFLFTSLISGFFLTFISLTSKLSSYEVGFNMLQLFFGFTPAVWSNWDNYNKLGRVVQMGYLFLIQFIIATILAIVLSQVFSKISVTNREEFNYTKTINLIIYFKTSKLNYEKAIYGTSVLNRIANVFKLPLVLMIYIYEKIISKVYLTRQDHTNIMKNFTFFDKDKDYFQDNEMMNLDDEQETNTNIAFKPRRRSVFSRGVSVTENFNIAHNNALVPAKSISTLADFKSASTDSLFIDALLSRRYGATGSGSTNEPHKFRLDSKSHNRENFPQRSRSKYLKKSISSLNINKPNKPKERGTAELNDKIENLETLIEQLIMLQSRNATSEIPLTTSAFQPSSVSRQPGIYNIAENSIDDIDSLNSSDISNHEPDDTINISYESDATY